MNPTPRWQQRFNNFLKALEQLNAAIQLSKTRPLSDLEKQGLIQAFEFTHELAWNVMKDYFLYQGNPDITGSRDAIREAYHKGLIQDGEQWMQTISSRNKTSHTYNPLVATEIVSLIVESYGVLFQNFANTLSHIRDSHPS